MPKTLIHLIPILTLLIFICSCLPQDSHLPEGWEESSKNKDSLESDSKGEEKEKKKNKKKTSSEEESEENSGPIKDFNPRDDFQFSIFQIKVQTINDLTSPLSLHFFHQNLRKKSNSLATKNLPFLIIKKNEDYICYMALGRDKGAWFWEEILKSPPEEIISTGKYSLSFNQKGEISALTLLAESDQIDFPMDINLSLSIFESLLNPPSLPSELKISISIAQ